MAKITGRRDLFRNGYRPTHPQLDGIRDDISFWDFLDLRERALNLVYDDPGCGSSTKWSAASCLGAVQRLKAARESGDTELMLKACFSFGAFHKEVDALVSWGVDPIYVHFEREKSREDRKKGGEGKAYFKTEKDWQKLEFAWAKHKNKKAPLAAIREALIKDHGFSEEINSVTVSRALKKRKLSIKAQKKAQN